MNTGGTLIVPRLIFVSPYSLTSFAANSLLFVSHWSDEFAQGRFGGEEVRPFYFSLYNDHHANWHLVGLFPSSTQEDKNVPFAYSLCSYTSG